MSLTEPVLLRDLHFECPFELGNAVRQERAEITRVASDHGIDLDDGQALDAVRSAIASGHLAAAKVVLPDTNGKLEVVDQAQLVASMERFFGEVRAGVVSLAPRRPTSPSNSEERRGPDVLRRWAWTGPGRWIAEHLVRSPRRFVRYAWSGPLRPTQIRSEILGLLERMQASQCRDVLEIGTYRGGTTYLLSHFTAADGHMVTCDLVQRVAVDSLRRGNRRGQSIEALELDSHSPDGRRRLHEVFPDGVDLLFIDGDHSYEGVRQDFLDYADLLRPGSILVFHDIVDDFATRYGITTWSWVGGVPRFWRELTAAAPSSFEIEELVRDRRQDGLGIGVIICPDAANPGHALSAAVTGTVRQLSAPSD